MARRSSRPKRDRQASSPSRKRTFALVGLGVFALADVALIALALGFFDSGEDAEQRTASAPSAPIAVSETPTPSPEPSASAPLAVPVLRSLAAVDENVAWRAERGSCETQAIIDVTTDGGATWSSTEPQTTEGHEVLWLWGQDDEYALATVTVGDDCELDGIRTFTSGAFWTASPDAINDAAYVDAAGALMTPDALISPCAVTVDVASADESTAVLCADGSVQRTLDGEAWATTSVPGAVALTDTGDAYAVAVQGDASCDGVALVSLSVEAIENAEAASNPRDCITGSTDPSSTVLDAAHDVVWVWTGGVHKVIPFEVLFA